LEGHRGRLKSDGVGVVGNNRDLGFFIHPTLVLDAQDGFPLGLSHVQLWSRAIAHRDKQERNYSKLPIEAKESYKWLASAAHSQRCLQVGDAQLVTHVGDREADLYEEWATVPDRYNHVLVRVHQDRRLFEKAESLYEYWSSQPCQGSYSIRVEGDARQKRTSREAWLNVRFTAVEIQRPDKLKAQDYPERIKLYAVEARESNPPKGQKPVHWRWMTTHEIGSFEQALQVIKWDCWRWRIEQLFATIKQKGLNVEASQMESGSAIQRLTLLALSVALRTLQMVEGRDHPAIPASVVFSEAQQQCLSQMAASLSGKTKKQQNPYPPSTLAWATW
jgi:hypothetical protein